MAQRIEGKTVLVLDNAEFTALNMLLAGLYDNRAAIDSLFEATNKSVILGPDDKEVLLRLWGSIHGMN